MRAPLFPKTYSDRGLNCGIRHRVALLAQITRPLVLEPQPLNLRAIPVDDRLLGGATPLDRGNVLVMKFESSIALCPHDREFCTQPGSPCAPMGADAQGPPQAAISERTAPA